MSLLQNSQISSKYDFSKHIIEMLSQILQQKFLKVEIGDFYVGNLFVENHNETSKVLN